MRIIASSENADVYVEHVDGQLQQLSKRCTYPLPFDYVQIEDPSRHEKQQVWPIDYYTALKRLDIVSDRDLSGTNISQFMPTLDEIVQEIYTQLGIDPTASWADLNSEQYTAIPSARMAIGFYTQVLMHWFFPGNIVKPENLSIYNSDNRDYLVATTKEIGLADLSILTKLKVLYGDSKVITSQKFTKEIESLANVIDSINSSGLFFRDFKPSNIVLHEGNLKLIDWDTSLGIAQDRRVATLGLHVPTLAYAHPQRLDPTVSKLHITERTFLRKQDVYSFAMFVATLLTELSGEELVAKIRADKQIPSLGFTPYELLEMCAQNPTIKGDRLLETMEHDTDHSHLVNAEEARQLIDILVEATKTKSTSENIPTATQIAEKFGAYWNKIYQ